MPGARSPANTRASLHGIEPAGPRLDVVRIAPDALRITDTRCGQMRYYDLSGDAARVYDACHAGVTLDAIARTTGLSRETITAALERFLRLTLVLRVDGAYLSLALRLRDELVRRFFVAHGPDVAAVRPPGAPESTERVLHPGRPRGLIL